MFSNELTPWPVTLDMYVTELTQLIVHESGHLFGYAHSIPNRSEDSLCEFGSTTYTLAITTDHGSVVRYPDKAQYAAGEKVYLIPRPEMFNTIRFWTGNITTKSPVAMVIMNANKSVTANFGPWTPPIGIPTPEFGITQTYRGYDPGGKFTRNDAAHGGPLTYTQNAEGGYYTHYIDNTDPNATDTDNPYGTLVKPRLTIPYTVSGQLEAGSVIEIHGGPYQYGNLSGGDYNIWIACTNGSATQPIFIRGATGTMPRHDHMVFRMNGNYCIVENLEMYDSVIHEHAERRGCHHLAYRNINSYGGPPTAGYCTSTIGPSHDIVIYGNYFHENGDTEYTAENDFSGFFASDSTTPAYNIWFIDNYTYKNGGDGFLIGNSGTGNIDYANQHIYIGRNCMNQDGENAIDLKHCRDLIASQNTAIGFHAPPYKSSDGTPFIVNDDQPHARIWFLANQVLDCVGAIRFQDSAYLIGNLVVNSGSVGGYTYNAITGYMFFNSIYGSGMYFGSGTLATVHMANNIIVGDTATENLVYIFDSGVAGRSTMNNNLLYNSAGPARISWGQKSSAIYESLTSFQTRTGKGKDCIEADPLFVDASQANLHLQSTSPAIEAGSSSGVVQEVFDSFQQLYGIDIRKDIESQTRPQGSAWDLGAYEYVLSPVGDLTVSGMMQNSVTLTWTVPGEPGVTGQPATYNLRYATSPITEANWDTATSVPGEPSAGVFGQPQSFTITGLNPGATYYLALKVLDEAGHSSLLSNVVSATTTTTGNHAPVLQLIGDRSVVEAETLTFSISATDTDGDALTYSAASLPTGAGIDSATGVFSWTPTEDQCPASYNLIVRVTDDGTPNLHDEEEITISVNEINTAPVLAAIGDKGINEGQPLTFTASATDGDLPANTLTFGLPNAPERAGINASNGVFSWTPTENQGPGAYNLTIRVTDNGTPNLYDEEVITVMVNEVNEAPTAVQLSATGIPENQPGGSTVGMLSTDDPDIRNTFTYSLVAGAGSTDNGSVVISSNLLKAAASFNYEVKNSYSIRVRTTDAGALWCEQTFTIMVADVNEAPTTIQLSNSSVPENQSAGTTVGTLSTTDPDSGGAFTYSLVAGKGSTDNGSFKITGSTLRTAASFDYEAENSYSIRVRTTDAGGQWCEQTFTIAVIDVNEAPTTIQLSSSTVREKQPAGTTVGKLRTTDPDSHDSFTYSLVKGKGAKDNNSFTINGDTLQTAVSFNYQAKNSYTIRVRATDSGGLVCECVFTITIIGGNQAPTAIQLSNSSVLENEPAGTTVGKLSTIDPDSNDTFTYSLVTNKGGRDGNSFTISGNTLLTAVSFNYEAKSSYSIRVRTTDSGGLTYEQAFTITAIDVDESPTALQLSNSVMPEDPVTGMTVGTLITTDPDSSDTFAYSLATTENKGVRYEVQRPNSVTGVYSDGLRRAPVVRTRLHPGRNATVRPCKLYWARD